MHNIKQLEWSKRYDIYLFEALVSTLTFNVFCYRVTTSDSHALTSTVHPVLIIIKSFFCGFNLFCYVKGKTNLYRRSESKQQVNGFDHAYVCATS